MRLARVVPEPDERSPKWRGSVLASALSISHLDLEESSLAYKKDPKIVTNSDLARQSDTPRSLTTGTLVSSSEWGD